MTNTDNARKRFLFFARQNLENNRYLRQTMDRARLTAQQPINDLAQARQRLKEISAMIEQVDTDVSEAESYNQTLAGHLAEWLPAVEMTEHYEAHLIQFMQDPDLYLQATFAEWLPETETETLTALEQLIAVERFRRGGGDEG